MSLNIIIGCMFSGKTSKLIQIARRNRSIDKKVLIINFVGDIRYGSDKIYTHDIEGLDCINLDSLDHLLEEKYNESSVICINEGQFFTDLVKFCIKALQDNKEVHVCGLDGDYLQRPFGKILDLIPLSDNVIRLHALCKMCNNGNPAMFTKRIVDSDKTLLIGGHDCYIPVCRKHLN